MDNSIYVKFNSISQFKNQINNTLNMRILGKGKTAKAIKDVYVDAILFDDNDKNTYDINSDELTLKSYEKAN